MKNSKVEGGSAKVRLVPISTSFSNFKKARKCLPWASLFIEVLGL